MDNLFQDDDSAYSRLMPEGPAINITVTSEQDTVCLVVVGEGLHEVAQRPGKPLWFGTDEKNNTTVIGLPGNPVSSLVCLHRYLIPGRKMFARLGEEIIFSKELTYFVPVKIEYREDGTFWAMPLKVKNSGEFTALAGSDGFIELPPGKSVFSNGEAFAFWPWRTA